MGLQGGIYDGWGQKSFLSDLCTPDAQCDLTRKFVPGASTLTAHWTIATQVPRRPSFLKTYPVASINSICWIGYEYRKLDSAILVMKAAKDRLWSDSAETLNRPTDWRVLFRDEAWLLVCVLAVLEWRAKWTIRRIAMSKARKGNKEKKKPKADKNQAKTHVSAYKAAQDQGKQSFNAFAKKTWDQIRLQGRVRGLARTRLALTSCGRS